jgi:hypothetical protein
MEAYWSYIIAGLRSGSEGAIILAIERGAKGDRGAVHEPASLREWGIAGTRGESMKFDMESETAALLVFAAIAAVGFAILAAAVFLPPI